MIRIHGADRGLLRWIWLFLLQLLPGGHIQAQDMGFKETLSYINSKLGPGFQVTVEKGVITAGYYENGHVLFRDDHVNPRDLDTSHIYYNQEEQLFCLNCLGGKNKCVDRNLYVNKISRGYSRMSFHVKLDAKSAAGLRKAFIHLIKLCLIHNYKSHEPFE